VTRARYQQVSLQDTPYYHCISRCVRRAYLCGEDPVSGRNFDHRKRWLVTRIKQLSAQFAVDVCAYAVMSNHYHLVLHVDEETASSWSDDEIIRRWTWLFPANGKLIETLQKNLRTKVARKLLQQKIDLWRQRLTDISWFMRCLNETLARQANREDECSGRFWEGRFKSQALLDEKALITCMAYVDLNPVRAGISDSLDASDFTSIQERLIQHAKKVKQRSYRQHRLLTRRNAKHLVGQSAVRQSPLKTLNALPGFAQLALPITQQSYFDLLETTCRALAFNTAEQSKATHLLAENESALQEFGISPLAWLNGVRSFHKYYAVAAGTAESLLHFHNTRIKSGVEFKHPHKWIRGLQPARQLFGS
jgi:REP element-mobilizing transposase RayT